MVRLFKRNQILNFVLLFALLAVFNIKPFLTLSLFDQQYIGLLSKFTFKILRDFASFIEGGVSSQSYTFQAFALIMIFIQALALNELLTRYNFFPRNNNLPGLTYALVCMSMAEFLIANPVLLANTVLIIILGKFFQVNKSDKPLSLSFDIGLLISIASLFYFPAIILLVTHLIILVNTRNFRWNVWIIGMIGCFIPYFLLAVYYFLTSDLLNLFTEILTDQFVNYQLLFESNQIRYYPLLIISILLGLSLFAVRINYLRTLVIRRHYITIVIWFLIIAGASLVLQPYLSVTHFGILIIPISILIGYYFYEVKRVIFADILIGLLMVLVLLGQYM